MGNPVGNLWRSLYFLGHWGFGSANFLPAGFHSNRIASNIAWGVICQASRIGFTLILLSIVLSSGVSLVINSPGDRHDRQICHGVISSEVPSRGHFMVGDDLHKLGNMLVSWNMGTPKSSILMGLSIKKQPFWGTQIYGTSRVVDKCGHLGFWRVWWKKSPAT